MILIAGPQPMASEAKESKPVRVRPDIHSMIKVIEAASEIQGKSFNTIVYLDDLIRDRITSDYRKALAILHKAEK